MEKILGKTVIRLEHNQGFNYIPWVRTLVTFQKMTEEDLKIWNEYRNFTNQVICTMFQDELMNWEDWTGWEYHPDNSNPRYFEYQFKDGPIQFDIDKLQYLVDVCNVANREITAKIEDFPLRITFFTHNLIFEGRHIKVKNVDAKGKLYTVTIDPQTKEV